MNVGSLFSGIGGLDHGLHAAGFKHVFLCESDEWRRGVLSVRFPGVPIYDDVRDVDGGLHARADERGARRERGRNGTRDTVDLLCGGFPCQDLSVAGRRAGLIAGERSSLFFEFMRVADELVPTNGWVLIENVPGLLSSNGGRDFAVVLATLADLGFHDLAWRVLDSRYFGVPQRRRRVFIVGRRASGRRAFEVLLEPESGGGDPPQGDQAGEGVAGTLGGGSGSRGWAQDVERMTFVPTAYTHSGGETFRESDTIGALTQQSASETSAMRPLIADTLTSGSHPGSNMPGRRREDDTNLVAFDTYNQTTGGTVQTLRDPNGTFGDALPAVHAAAGVRRLTPVECERLQGLPDDWTRVPDTAPDSRRYAGLGDAVTSPVGAWIGHRIKVAA